MKNICYFLLISLSALTLSCSGKGNDDENGTNLPEEVKREQNLKSIKGNSIQVDPYIFNDLNITPEQFIADLKKADIKSVHFMVAKY